jgi:hypothetical protein
MTTISSVPSPARYVNAPATAPAPNDPDSGVKTQNAGRSSSVKDSDGDTDGSKSSFATQTSSGVHAALSELVLGGKQA